MSLCVVSGTLCGCPVFWVTVYTSSVVCLFRVLCEIKEELMPCILVSGSATMSRGMGQGQEAMGSPMVEEPCVCVCVCAVSGCVAGSEGMYTTSPPASLPGVVNGLELCLPGHAHLCAVGRDIGTLLAKGEIVLC